MWNLRQKVILWQPQSQDSHRLVSSKLTSIVAMPAPDAAAICTIGWAT